MIKQFVSNIRLLAMFSRDNRGVTALEYGLIAAVVGSVIAVGFNTYGTNLKNALAALVV